MSGFCENLGRSVLNHTVKAIEHEDLEPRLAELERAADASKEGRR